MTPTLPAADNHIEYEVSPERRLMLAVLLTAILDASGQAPASAKRDRRKICGTALGWIKEAGPDFLEVCEMAGINPVVARRGAMQYIESTRDGPTGPRLRRHTAHTIREQAHA